MRRRQLQSNPGRHAVEEVYDAGFQRVFGANDQKSVALNQLLQHFRAVSQMIRRYPNIGAHRVFNQRISLMGELSFE